MARIFSLASVAALLLLSLACGGSHSSTPTQNMASPPSGSAVTVQVKDSFYSPQNVTVAPGTTVQWVLEGSLTTHTVTDSGGAFDSGMTLTQPGAMFTHTFTTADSGKTFNYFCRTHAACCGMRGAVQVGSSAPGPNPGY